MTAAAKLRRPGSLPYIKFSRPGTELRARQFFDYNLRHPESKLTTAAMSNIDVYRKRAAECQRQADAAVLDSVRETLQEIADKYLALAANEERSAVMPGSANGRGTPSPDARG